jgi:MYXO-CTERM domain-containing protein
MRLIRAAAALLTVLGAGMAGAILGPGPAYAGNWATTVLDPVPDRFEPGRSYTIGFWVLQHGSHPYEGTLDPVALQLVAPHSEGQRGATTTFPGIALPEPAHYATTIYLPTAGAYTVVGQQGIFQPFRVGTLAAPGALTALPVPTPMEMPADKLPWKEIRPPTMPVDADRNPFDETATNAPAAKATTPTAAAAPETTPTASESRRPTATVLIALAGLAVVFGILLYRRRRPAR